MTKKQKAAGSSSVSLDDFLGAYRAPRKSVRVTTRADLLAEHAQLQDAYQRAQRGDLSENRIPEAPAIRDRIAELEDEIGASQFTFTFQALPRGEYLALVGKHPPRDEDKKAALPFNADTFTPELLAACAVEPEMDIEAAAQVLEVLSPGQFDKVWTAVVAVNLGDDAAPKSVLRSAPDQGRGETPSSSAADTPSP